MAARFADGGVPDSRFAVGTKLAIRARSVAGALRPAARCFAWSFAGAWTVTRVPADFIRGLLPCVLVAVAIYTFKKKDFGAIHAPVHSGMTEKLVAIGMGACIGFYDGFFGPGTGSFLMFLFVRFFGFDFLSASAAAKVVNVACNFAALMWFGYSGHLLWQLGLLMAVCQVAGSLVGTKLAIKHGSVFVRKLFLVVVSLIDPQDGLRRHRQVECLSNLFHVKHPASACFWIVSRGTSLFRHARIIWRQKSRRGKKTL